MEDIIALVRKTSERSVAYKLLELGNLTRIGGRKATYRAIEYSLVGKSTGPTMQGHNSKQLSLLW